ncbi:GAF domain-containing protein [Planobispora longispora]|uniref:GAF domain-containing protein n=1 Tax=Planobispora longispora TaxID=28887 RepID=A0A8J3RGQ7_9ACTN|nr:GAF domain-containing protein [Planobispora longispora]BFE77592.1 hypothetical protein GCM10020093_001930 [Planobispora longispora]GIH73911.1 hypothetical protein Plo01_03400 [Planobispora longispora]
METASAFTPEPHDGSPAAHDSAPAPAHATRERLAAVRRYEILDAPTDGTFDEIAQIAADVFETPIATVTIVDADRVWFAACQGLEGVTQIGTEPGLCASAVLSDDLYVVRDAAVDPRTLDHPLVRGELGLRFYAAAPIITDDGHRLGTVNVIDQQPRKITPMQESVLSQLAKVVARHLDLRLATLRAVRAEQELRADAERRAAAAAELAERLRQSVSAHHGGERPETCELGGARQRCPQQAELKIVDGWGNAAWGCLSHAEESLFASGTFIANPEQAGLAAYLNRKGY